MIRRQTSRDGARLLGTLALVIALHAILVWLCFRMTQTRTLTANSRALEIFFIAPPVVPPPVVTPRPAKSPLAQPGEGAIRQPLAKHPATAPRNKAAAAAPDAGAPVQPPPIDWVEELSRAAKDSSAAQAGPQLKDFGFPQLHQAPSPKSPGFSWSHSRTHRVESIPGGGILVNLNDNCVLVFLPLPMVACRPGKKPANGDLFDPLHDAPAADDAKGVP